MKHLLMLFFFLGILLQAADASVYETSLYTGTLFLFLLMLAIIIVQMRRSASDKALLKEKEEKITWLRQVHAENDRKYLTQIQELEKEILKRNHTIDKLELKLSEGTKNQVVLKIEELRAKRRSAERGAVSDTGAA